MRLNIFKRRGPVKHKPNQGVKITTNNGDESGPTPYGCLIIACDPQDGLKNNVMRKTKQETKIFSKENMSSFTFQTTLIKVPKADSGEVTVRFFPKMLNITDGSVYGYRSETRKELVYQVSNGRFSSFDKRFRDVEFEFVTIYQLLDPTKHGAKSKDELRAMLDKQMNDSATKKWFPYNWSDAEILTSFHTKYFDHFQLKALKTNPNNWDILDIQGKKNTIYVHASTAFESVLHIYWYIEQLVVSHQSILPRDKDCKIAIIGGGPSGLLMARKLVQMGYTDIKILESKENNSGAPPELTALYAGKTQTNLFDQTSVSPKDKVPAELGTCYLSPAYDNMIGDFKKTGLLKGQDRVSFDQEEGLPVLREIVIDDQFSNDGPINTLIQTSAGRKLFDKSIVPRKLIGEQLPPTIEASAYYKLKGFEAYYEGKVLDNVVDKFEKFDKLVLAPTIVKYILFHVKNFGTNRPFAPDRKRVNKDLFRLNIPQFLEKYKFKAMLGTLQYGYSVQGYGSTAPDSTMPAFYLLMWITPGVLIVNLEDRVLGLVKELCPKHLAPIIHEKPIISAFTKGWGTVWDNLKEQFDDEKHPVHIDYGVDIKRITRSHRV